MSATFRIVPSFLILCLLTMPLFADEPSLPLEKVLTLAPTEANPRNSEGDFIILDNGDILFIYTHFSGGSGDGDTAWLASRRSSDGGATWTQTDEVVLENEGQRNIMSVSLLRLQDGSIALFSHRSSEQNLVRPAEVNASRL